jgi:hypothetical protein
MTREELQQTYSKLPTEKLLEILDRKFDYTELAVSVALEELGSRKVSEEEIKNYKTEQINKVETFIKKNISDDLTLLQKNLFYFLWLPILNFAFKMNFGQDGYVLKLKQANYYSLLGFIFFMVAGIVSVIFDLSDLSSLAIWILGFVQSYFFDEYFNRQKQIEKLRKVFGVEDEHTETEDDNQIKGE